jgi:hypothetical protein
MARGSRRRAALLAAAAAATHAALGGTAAAAAAAAPAPPPTTFNVTLPLALDPAPRWTRQAWRERGTTTFGGSAVLGDDGLYHLFATRLLYGCGLADEPTNAVVDHLVASSPAGPYAHSDVALPLWHTQPAVTRSPGGGYLLFAVGTAAPTLPPVNCSGGGGAPPARPLRAAPPPYASWLQAYSSPSPYGPWTSVAAGSGSPYAALGTAPSPWWAPGDAALTLAYLTPAGALPGDVGALAVAVVPDVAAVPYTPAYTPDLGVPPGWAVDDPFLWRDPAPGDGFAPWRLLLHARPANASALQWGVGAFAHSADLASGWDLRLNTSVGAPGAAYTLDTAWDDGSRSVLGRRERPSLLFGGAGGSSGVTLLTGACFMSPYGGPSGSDCFTMAQPLRADGPPPPRACRVPWDWPFTPASIWNTPIGSGADYRPAGIYAGAPGSRTGPPVQFHVDQDELVIATPEDPVTPWWDQGGFPGSCVNGGALKGTMVLPFDYVNDCAVANNNGAGLLQPDGDTVMEVQPLYRPVAGGPVWAFYNRGAPLPTPPNVSIRTGDGALGAHGGSGLSSYGGTIRLGELRPESPPIAHALKLELWAGGFYFYNWSSANYSSCYVWPAIGCDGYHAQPGIGYNGTNPLVVPGALLAVPPAAAPGVAAGLRTEPARRILAALTDYGGYLVDDTGSQRGGGALCAEAAVKDELAAVYGYSLRIEDPATPDGPSAALYADLVAVVQALHVVANNGPATVGGGGVPRRPPPPPFCD